MRDFCQVNVESSFFTHQDSDQLLIFIMVPKVFLSLSLFSSTASSTSSLLLSSPSCLWSGLGLVAPSPLGLQKKPDVAFMTSRLQDSLGWHKNTQNIKTRWYSAIVSSTAGPKASVGAQLINQQKAHVRGSGLASLKNLTSRCVLRKSNRAIRNKMIMMTQERGLLLFWPCYWAH